MGDELMLYAFVMGGALFHASANIATKKLVVEGVHEDFVTVGKMAGAAIVGFAGSFVFFGLPAIQSGFWLPFAAGAILNVFIQYLNVISLKHEDASIVVPLSSTMPVFAIAMSYAILGEWPTFWGRIGIGLIALGAYILYLGGKPVELPGLLKDVIPEPWQTHVARYGAPWLRLGASRGAQLALLTAYLGAVSVNADKLVVLYSNPPFRTGSTFGVVAGVVLAHSWKKGVWEKIPKSQTAWLSVLAVGATIGITDALYSVGYWYGIVPYVGALKRTQILWVVLLAVFLLKEGYAGQRLVGSTILFVGATLLAF